MRKYYKADLRTYCDVCKVQIMDREERAQYGDLQCHVKCIQQMIVKFNLDPNITIEDEREEDEDDD